MNRNIEMKREEGMDQDASYPAAVYLPMSPQKGPI